MKVEVDYYIYKKEDFMELGTYTFTGHELEEIVAQMFIEGHLSHSMHLNPEECRVEVNVATVTT